MRRPRVLVGVDPATDDVLDEVARRLATEGYRVTRQREAGVLDPPEVDVDVLCVVSRTPIYRALLAAAPSLRGVVYLSSGTDGCDTEAAAELGIEVRAGSTEAVTDGMAEAVLALMLNLRMDLHRKQRLAPGASRPPNLTMAAATIRHSTVGFLGFGRIARRCRDLLLPFAPAAILAHTRHPLPSEEGVELVPVRELFRRSDILSVHVPISAGTRGLVNATLLSEMKPEAVIIATSRGGVVDEFALADALHRGVIAGAAVDTFEQEPPPADHPLRSTPNTIVTPHIAGHTARAFRELADLAVRNVQELATRPDPRRNRT